MYLSQFPPPPFVPSRLSDINVYIYGHSEHLLWNWKRLHAKSLTFNIAYTSLFLLSIMENCANEKNHSRAMTSSPE